MTRTKYRRVIERRFGIDMTSTELWMATFGHSGRWADIKKRDPDLNNYKNRETKYKMFRILATEWMIYNEDLIKFKLL